MMTDVKIPWISVKDELPDIGQIVMMRHFVGESIYYEFGGRVEEDEGWMWGKAYGTLLLPLSGNHNDIEVDDEYYVTHWMPLTEPDGM